jgi:hypothetical protein
VYPHPAGRLDRTGVPVAHDDHVPHRGQVGQHAGQQRDERGVHDHHPVAGVVGDVRELVREQPQVQRVQHGAHAGHGQVCDQVLGVVPHQRRHPLVAGYPQLVA